MNAPPHIGATLTHKRAIDTYRQTQRFETKPVAPEPVNFCAPAEDTDAPLPTMLFRVAAALTAWALFGWAVIALCDVLWGAK